MKLLVATTNRGKVEEIKRVLEPLGFEIILPVRKLEVEESGHTFLENAYLKAEAYYKEFRMPSLADDSGLEVKALEGFPGVFSSRFYEIDFGGKEEPIDTVDEANIRKLLRMLEGKDDRRARFVAYVVVYFGGKGIFSHGECRGEITQEPRGSGGFGYDPVFKPEGYERTMAELTPEEKDAISHRGKALRRLASFLKNCSGYKE